MEERTGCECVDWIEEANIRIQWWAAATAVM